MRLLFSVFSTGSPAAAAAASGSSSDSYSKNDSVSFHFTFFICLYVCISYQCTNQLVHKCATNLYWNSSFFYLNSIHSCETGEKVLECQLLSLLFWNNQKKWFETKKLIGYRRQWKGVGAQTLSSPRARIHYTNIFYWWFVCVHRYFSLLQYIFIFHSNRHERHASIFPRRVPIFNKFQMYVDKYASHTERKYKTERNHSKKSRKTDTCTWTPTFATARSDLYNIYYMVGSAVSLLFGLFFVEMENPWQIKMWKQIYSHVYPAILSSQRHTTDARKQKTK